MHYDDTPATLLCNGRREGQQSAETTNRGIGTTTERVLLPLGESVPLFVIAPYAELDQPPVHISYLPNHKSEAETYASAAQLAAPLVSEWFGAGTSPIRSQS